MFNQFEQQQTINTKVQKSQRIVYKADFLKSIKCKVDQDQRYRLFHPNICSTVRKLKLNKKKIRRRNNQAPISKFQQSYCNKMYSKQKHLQHVY